MQWLTATLAFVSTTVVCGSIATVTVTLTWSGSPAGATVHQWFLAERDACMWWGLLCFCSAGTLAGVSYLVDLPDWKYSCYFVKALYFAVILAALVVGLTLMTPVFPCMPLFLSVAAMFFSVRAKHDSRVDMDTEESLLFGKSAAFLFVACVLFYTWLVWSKALLVEGRLRRTLASEDAFVWAWSPFLLGVLCAACSMAAWMRASLTERAAMVEEGNMPLPPQLQVTIIVLTSCAFFSWVAAMVAAESQQLAGLIIKTAALMFVAIFLYVADWVGHHRAVLLVERNRKLQQVKAIVMNDWLKAVVLLASLPFLPLLILVDCLHQRTRQCCEACGLLQPHEGEHRYSWLTIEGSWLLEEIMAWAWGSVLVKCMYASIAHYCVQVGVAQGLVLFLAWFNEAVEDWSIWSATFVLFIVEIALFLFPPVAGIPLYMIAGVVMIPKVMGLGYTWYHGVVISTLFALFLKLTATGLEQKAIGEPMRNSITVKKFIGVHTPFMKSVRVLLSQRGFSFAKVAVLVGGPDWPTSVITGILGLPMLEMLLGTVPVVVLIIPVMVSAGLKLAAPKSGQPDLFDALSNLSLVVATLMQGAASIGAAYFAQAGMNEHQDDFVHRRSTLCRDPQETEVLVALAHDEEVAREWEKLTCWEVLPPSVRFVLVLGTLFSSVTSHIVANPAIECFTAFTITQKVSALDGGVIGLVQLAGQVSLGTVGVASLCLVGYHTWCWLRVKLPVEDTRSSIELTEHS